jgi:hypothetical protein
MDENATQSYFSSFLSDKNDRLLLQQPVTQIEIKTADSVRYCSVKE